VYGFSESWDCECGDGTTATDMYILCSRTSKEEEWMPSSEEVRMVWMGFMMLIFDANGAN
jgi:hypothetical protein